MKRWTVALVLALLLSGCAKEDWVAKVGNTIITSEDIEKAQRMGVTKEEALDNLIENALFYEDALTEGYPDKMEDEIKGSLNKIMVRELYNRIVLGGTSVSMYEIKDYWNKTNKEMIAFKLVVRDKDKANKIYRELLRDGNFKEIAKKESIDRRTAPTGGALGWVQYTSRMDEKTKDVIFSLKKGKFSAPFKTGNDFAIVMVENIRYKEGKELDNNEIDRIRGILKREKERKVSGDYLVHLKTIANIRFNENVLKTLANSVGRSGLPDISSCGEGAVVLKSNVMTITASELINLAETRRRPPMNDPESIKNFLTGYLTYELVLPLEARRHKIHKDPEIAHNIDEITRNIIIRDYKRTEIDSKLKGAGEEEIKKYYEENKDSFKEDKGIKPLDEVRSHIVRVLRDKEKEQLTAQLIQELKGKFNVELKES